MFIEGSETMINPTTNHRIPVTSATFAEVARSSSNRSCSEHGDENGSAAIAVFHWSMTSNGITNSMSPTLKFQTLTIIFRIRVEDNSRSNGQQAG
jgi:hypothetical protein